MRCARCYEPLDGDPLLTGTEDSEAVILCGECEDDIAAPVFPLDIEATFAKGGPLSAGNPAYEARPGQVRLSRAIHDALVNEHHLMAEGPCGIGKSKAYGVPAAHVASQGKRVMIVTASIALQEQLVRKDLPALAAELERPFTFELLKGRGNYLCLEESALAASTGLFPDALAEFKAVETWAAKTETGDRAELLVSPSDLVWGRFTTSTDACPRSKCGSFEKCWATKARERASEAGIVVTNYHLFFLNMASGGRILPACDLVILDEAHEAADIAREFLGFRVNINTFNRLAKDAEKRHAEELGVEIRESAGAFFAKLLRFHDCPHYDQKVIRGALPFDANHLEEMVSAYADAFPKSHLVDYADKAIRTLKEAISAGGTDCVYSIDVKENGRRERIPSLVARYVSPGGVLSKMLWSSFKSVVAVSATMTTDGKFDFARAELGAPKETRELIVESPFDFGRQALLVVPPPSELPEPNDPRFLAATAQRVIEVIEACGGRTLALFTSYRALNGVYDIVRHHFDRRITILKQGEMATGALTALFKSDVRSVLLATTSFWTGIDVPGEALTGLVIDRLPFGSPDDPISIRLAEKDKAGFFAHHYVPKSILALRQGVGRLIRSSKDVGAIVILDRRLSTATYGARFLRSLPRMSRAASTTAIRPFLKSRGVAA